MDMDSLGMCYYTLMLHDIKTMHHAMRSSVVQATDHLKPSHFPHLGKAGHARLRLHIADHTTSQSPRHLDHLRISSNTQTQ